MIKPISISFLLSVFINLLIISIISSFTTSEYRKIKEAPPIEISLIENSSLSTNKITNSSLTIIKHRISDNSTRKKAVITVNKKQVRIAKAVKKAKDIVKKKTMLQSLQPPSLYQEAKTAFHKDTTAVTPPSSKKSAPKEIYSEETAAPVSEEADTKKTDLPIKEESIALQARDLQLPRERSDEFVPLNRLTKIPAVIGNITPVYPQNARRLSIEGTVRLEVSIDALGQVTNVAVVKSADFGFDEAAVKAVNNARFSPALMDKMPVPVKVLIPVKFVLQ